MEIQCGTEVIDKRGNVLGAVTQVIRNTYTGELSKFVVYRKDPVGALFFSPGDVLEATDIKIKVNISIDELSENT